MASRVIHRLISAAAAAVAGLVLAGSAEAQATYQGNAAASLPGFFDGDSGTTIAPASYFAAVGGENASSVSSNAHGGTVTSTAFTTLGLAAASTQLQYTAMLVGPDGPAVPVEVLANGSATGIGLGSSASAFFTLELHFQTLTGYASRSFGGTDQSFAVDTIAPFFPNHPFTVTILAMADGDSLFDNLPTISFASVDPMFIVDPLFADAYHFEGIPFDAGSGAPEPSGWALAIAGFALTGLSLRRRPRVSLA